MKIYDNHQVMLLSRIGKTCIDLTRSRKSSTYDAYLSDLLQLNVQKSIETLRKLLLHHHCFQACKTICKST